MNAKETLTWMKDNGQDVRGEAGEPSPYRLGLAAQLGITAEEVDGLIVEVWGTSSRVHPEDAAQRVLAHDGRTAHSAGGRKWNHEED